MKHLVLTLTIIGSTFFFSSLKEADKTVYICASKTAKKYHYKKNCRGLSACKHEVKAIDLSKAKSSGRTLCGWED